MPNIYESNELYYLKEGSYYRLYDVLTRRTTIVLMPTDVLVNSLEDYKVITYKELRDRRIKHE